MSPEKTDYLRVGRNTITLFVSNVSTKIISFIYMIFLARHLGEAGLGQLTFASAFVELFNIFSDFGLSTIAVREVSRNRDLSNTFLRNLLTLRLLISTLVFVAIVAVAFASGFSIEVIAAVVLYGLASIVLSISFTYQSILNAFEKMYYGSVISIAVTALVSMTGFVFIYLGYGVVWFASVQLLWAIPTGLAYVICGRRESLKFKFAADYLFWKRLIRMAIPIGFGVAMYVLYNRIDLVMLKYMKNDYDVGIYSVAYRMMGYFNFLIWALMGASAPAFAKCYGRDPQQLGEIAGRSYRYLIFAGVPIALGGSALARPIIEFLYSGRFAESGAVFSLLALSTAIVFFGATFGTILLNADSRSGYFYARVAAAGVILNVALNFILIPRFSYYGAAAATVVTDLFTSVIGCLYVTIKIVKIDILKPLAKSCLAGLPMTVGVIFLAGTGLWLPVTIVVGAFIYIVSMIVLRYFSGDDVRLMKDLFLAGGSFLKRDR